MKYSSILSFLFLAAFSLGVFFAPVEVLAQTPSAGGGAVGNFVPCSGEDCQFCHFVDLGSNVLGWLFGIVFVLFAVMIFAAGFGLVTSGGNTSSLDAAKTRLSNAIIGIIIVFCAWLIVDTLLKAALPDGQTSLGPWNQIECDFDQRDPNAIDIVTPEGGGGEFALGADCTSNLDGTQTCVTTADEPIDGQDCELLPPPQVGYSCSEVRPLGTSGAAASGCASCVGIPSALPTKGDSACEISASPTGQCMLPPSLANALTAMHQSAGVSGARVTEAWPPTGWSEDDPSGIHSNACHGNGTCVDYGKAGGMTALEIVSVINSAEANGLRPVYEVRTSGERDALVRAGVPAGNIQVVSRITAPHFSIYQ